MRLSSRPVCWRRRRDLCALPAVVVLLVHREGHGGGSHCCLGAWRQHIVAGSGFCVVSHAAAAWSCGKRGSRSRRQERRSSTTPKLSPEDGQQQISLSTTTGPMFPPSNSQCSTTPTRHNPTSQFHTHIRKIQARHQVRSLPKTAFTHPQNCMSRKCINAHCRNHRSCPIS